MDEVVQDVYAASSRGPMDAKMRTNMKFLACWNLPLVPYTAEVVYALGAALKWRKYRSAHLYLYLSRTVAEREGAYVDVAAQRALKDVIRSCKRGLGPAKHCEGLVLELMPDLPGNPRAWAAGGPWRPRGSLILGSWWLLREIEFSNAELRSIAINSVQRTVAWTLPASKTDSSALGETVTHGCCCTWERSGRAASLLCPYHLFRDHIAAYQSLYPQRFNARGEARRGHPLFPDEQGCVCTKLGVTATIRAAARHLGQTLMDPGGLYLHSGHALRVTGAQGLARAGLPELTIALLARWGSSAVRTYIRKAPLAASHHLASLALAGWERNSSSSQAPFAASSITAPSRAPKLRSRAVGKLIGARVAVLGLRERLTAAEQQLSELQTWRSSLVAAVPPVPVAPAGVVDEVIPPNWDGIDSAFQYVTSVRGKCHSVQVGYPAHPCTWCTICGWRLGSSDVAQPVLSLPVCHKPICDRCLRNEKEVAKALA